MILTVDQMIDCLKIPINQLSKEELEVVRAIITKHRNDPIINTTIGFDSLPNKIKSAIRSHPSLSNVKNFLK